MRRLALFLMLVAVSLAGCVTGPVGDVHSIPVARDYGRLKEVSLDEAAERVAQAECAGAACYAPYEFFSAEAYLALAREMRDRRDRLGARDYAGLALDMADAALRKGPSSDTAEPPLRQERGQALQRQGEQAVRDAFDRLKTRYLALNRDRAEDALPVLYARLTAAMSQAEHELNQARGWRRAAYTLALAEPAIDAILAQDTDGDGIPDMTDADPRLPEDLDSFQDEDGAPDLDNDLDGVPDVLDAAPNAPETRNGWHDADGAPDEYPELEPVHFASGSATLSPEARGYLRGIKELLDEWPALVLHLRGHADNTHSSRYSLDLSRRRAQNVRRRFLELGVPEAQLVVTFHGSSEPIADNGTPGGRATNRRVELVLE